MDQNESFVRIILIKDCESCNKELRHFMFENDNNICIICKYGEKSNKSRRCLYKLNFYINNIQVD